MTVRPASTFGPFAIGIVPSDLSGADPSAILADRRMSEGGRLEAEVTRATSWVADATLSAGPVNVTPSRRLVEFLAGLASRGVRVGSFSLLGAHEGDARSLGVREGRTDCRSHSGRQASVRNSPRGTGSTLVEHLG